MYNPLSLNDLQIIRKHLSFMLILWSTISTAQIYGNINVTGGATVVNFEDCKTIENAPHEEKNAQKLIVKAGTISNAHNQTETKNKRNLSLALKKNKTVDYKKISKSKTVPKNFVKSTPSDKNFSIDHSVHFFGCNPTNTFHLISPHCDINVLSGNSFNADRNYAYSSGYIRFLLSDSYTTRPPPAI